MSIATMLRVTRNMPGKVLGVAIGGSKPTTLTKSKSKIQARQRSKISLEAVKAADEDGVSAKRLAELEEKIIALLAKPATMPADKEEMLQAAVSRVSALEEELAATKKVSSSTYLKTTTRIKKIALGIHTLALDFPFLNGQQFSSITGPFAVSGNEFPSNYHQPGNLVVVLTLISYISVSVNDLKYFEVYDIFISKPINLFTNCL